MNIKEFKKRITELKALKQGWLDGDGAPINDYYLKLFTKMLIDLNKQNGLPLPHLYPTPEGMLQAEWSAGSWEISAETDAAGNINLHAVDCKPTKSQHTTLSKLAIQYIILTFELLINRVKNNLTSSAEQNEADDELSDQLEIIWYELDDSELVVVEMWTDKIQKMICQ